MAAVTDKQYNTLLAEVKKNSGQSERHYAEKSGIPQSKLLPLLIKAELEANPSLKISATAASVSKARESGLRWPRIAGYAGISVAKAKELYEEKNGSGSAGTSYTGRGRNFANGGSNGATRSTRGTSGRRTATKTASTGTSGRRGRGAATKTASAPASRKPGRRGTRAAAAANPK